MGRELVGIFGGGGSSSTSSTNVTTTVTVEPRLYSVVDFEALADPLARLADALRGYGVSTERAAVTAIKGAALTAAIGGASAKKVSDDWLGSLASWATIGAVALALWALYEGKKAQL